MLEESKELIIKHFLTIMKECNVDVLKEFMVKKGVFSASEMVKIFSSNNVRHNKRVFFFDIQKKEQKAFNILIEALKETNQHHIVKLLLPGVTGCRPFSSGNFVSNREEPRSLENVPVHINSDIDPLNINVVTSKEFLDTVAHNDQVAFYRSRSKKRGRVLIINNYKYEDSVKHKYRNGATIDNKNLHDLFTQMGGWKIDQHNNVTTEQMEFILKKFSRDKENKEYDICVVIMMAHGGENLSQTIIFGIDGNYIKTHDVHKHFTNDNCRGFRGKPKMFLFQVCRGSTLDHIILRTEVDGAQRSGPSFEHQSIDSHIRTQEDMLTGYATLHGFKAHRDPYRGSWYIELICKKFMAYAHKYPVTTLLQLVDQELRGRMSEKHTMQTAEHRNKGFKNLYLNPGIYFEDGELKHFHVQ